MKGCEGCEKELFRYFGYSTTCGKCVRYDSKNKKDCFILKKG